MWDPGEVEGKRAGYSCGLGGVRCQENTLRTCRPAWVSSSCGARTRECSGTHTAGLSVSLARVPTSRAGGAVGVSGHQRLRSHTGPWRPLCPNAGQRLREGQRLVDSCAGSGSSAETRSWVSLFQTITILPAAPRKRWDRACEGLRRKSKALASHLLPTT